MVARYVCQGMNRDAALNITGITRHQYYYHPSNNKRGRVPSETTRKVEGDICKRVSNEMVITDIKNIKKDPDANYGYKKMAVALMILGYFINHKKVYRLMKQSMLLKEKHQKHKREFVKHRRVFPERPLQVLEMDIKYTWIEKDRRHAFTLTVIDTFTRVLLGRVTAYSIKQNVVKSLWMKIIENYLQPYDCLNKRIHIEIRNDNDSRFIALSVQKFFKDNKLEQVFTHPYTPQENGHIESFHAILSEKLNRYNFWSLQDLEQCLILFYEKYNNHRIHSSTAYLPPMVFWQCWERKLIKTIINEKKKTMKHKLTIPYQQISGNMSRREVLCTCPKIPKEFEGMSNKEMYGAETFLQQPSV